MSANAVLRRGPNDGAPAAGDAGRSSAARDVEASITLGDTGASCALRPVGVVADAGDPTLAIEAGASCAVRPAGAARGAGDTILSTDAGLSCAVRSPVVVGDAGAASLDAGDAGVSCAVRSPDVSTVAADPIGGDAGLSFAAEGAACRVIGGRGASLAGGERDGGVATAERIALPVDRVVAPERRSPTVGVVADEPGVRTLRVALAGCGVVGGALVRLLAGSAGELRARHGLRIQLVSVLVRDLRKARPEPLDTSLLTGDVARFLATDADVVVEALGGEEPAGRIAREALEAGRRLVTANKALIATHGPALASLARRRGTRLDFESAVAGGIPVVRALRDSLPLTGITAVRGILNGTTNYVLSRLEEGWKYADALAKAQALGFAEEDPARDVGGQDAADKVRILAWLAFGVDPATLAVRRRGIVPDPDRLARAASVAGGVLRSVAEAVRTDDGVAAVVEPVILAPDADLARVRDEDNAVRVESAWNGAVRLAGPGAGGEATASALLGDVVRAAQHTPPTSPAAAAGADRRRHRWIIGVSGRCGEDAYLRRVLSRAEIEAEVIGRADGDVFARTQPVPWSRAELAFRVLEGAGCRPVLVRDERG